MEQEIIPLDLHRMILGEQPALFYVEILIRTLVIYAYTLVMIRWVGGRGVAQLSMVEFLLVIALGSAVGDAMFYPEVPLLHAMLVVTVVVAINKALDAAIQRWNAAKHVIDGKPVELVHKGRLLPEGLAARNLGASEVKAMLRLRGVANLGEVEHAFMEAGGGLSLFRAEQGRPGLALLPPEEIASQPALPDVMRQSDRMACCGGCGTLRAAAEVVPDTPCAHCGCAHWVAPEQAHPERSRE